MSPALHTRSLTTILFLVASFFPHPAVTADKHPEGAATMFGTLAALGNASSRSCRGWSAS